MKNKFIFTATAVLLLCVGVLLYATTNKSTTLTTFSTEEVADNTETVSSPPEVFCTAYAYRLEHKLTGEVLYDITTFPIELPYINNDYRYTFLESREGTVMENFVGGPSLCSAYYSLCDDYGVEYHYQ
ncbi:MAG: hypothetical protein J6C80_04055 [Flavobacteriales bacterium]|nr:hypothetical protein [Flavobacteriales bacterium]